MRNYDFEIRIWLESDSQNRPEDLADERIYDNPIPLNRIFDAILKLNQGKISQ